MKKLFVAMIVCLFSFAAFANTRGNSALANHSAKAKIHTVKYDKDTRAEFAPGLTGNRHMDRFGSTHETHQQTYKGIPVFGGAKIVHTNRSGKEETTGRVAVIKGLNIRAKVAQDQALKTVGALLPGSNLSASLVVLPLTNDNHLAWHVVESAFASRWNVFVDAHSGEILTAFNAIQHGEGTGVLGDTKTIDTTAAGNGYEMVSSNGMWSTYDARNRSRLPGSLFTDADDIWTDGAAVDAHAYAGMVLDFYWNTFGRNSWDGNGAEVISTVHYQRDYVNAFWNGTQMVYGDGDGVNSVALSGGFDVVAHEISHAVTETTSGLIYQDESGALNEAFSDIMAATAEYYMQPSEFDWLVGEDIWLADVALRFMDDPTRDGYSSDHYDDRYTGTSDNGGVHGNSGIANLAFVLAVQGGSHPTYGGSYTGVGMDTASQIFYTAFTSYLGPSATFADARAACELVASENYSQSVADAISAAWQAVGAPDGGSTDNGPTTIELSQGETFGSDHPYADSSNIVWSYTNPGASSVTVTFSTIDMERNYDYIYVRDAAGNTVASFTAKHRNGATVTVPGDTLTVNMVTDAAVNKYGFDATVQ